MKIMKAGQTYDVPDQPDLIMTTGNAGGIEIEVDGTTVPALGNAGTIRKDISLDPERLKAAPSLTRR
jgi:cytoskeleton protein RodZ